MSLDHETGALPVERLGPTDLPEVFGFLDRDPVLNVYLLALALRDGLAHPRDEFWGVRRDGGLEALAYLGGQSGAVLPCGTDERALAALSTHTFRRVAGLPRRFQVIGLRRAVDPLVARLEETGLTPRIFRPQSYLAVPRGRLLPFERLPALRPARPEDYAGVYESGALLRSEELDEDPRSVDPAAYARRVEEECRDGYTWLWIERGELRFRASVSALTSDAVQISGVYVPPDQRNRGQARRALSELCVRLLERTSAACLFVNDFNAPALAVYRRIGFELHAEWASAFYDRASGPPAR
jgi:ribosomal protein S18 acetylase RimI-like enzyme